MKKRAIPTRLEVRRLQTEWYAKLADSGFEDIEYGREDGLLKVANRENRGGVDPLDYESTISYFSQAGEFLEWGTWTNATHRDAWRMHAEGASLREIASAHGRSFKWAICLVERLRKAMATWQAATRADEERVAETVARTRAKRLPLRAPRGVQLELPFEESAVRK